MITIGEFSKLCKITTKTLRYYDNIGLFKPAYIDKTNDYRYYTSNQFNDILLIKKLKSYDFSLIEISNLINNSKDFLVKAIEKKTIEKKLNIERELKLLSEMKNYINTIKKDDEKMNFAKDLHIETINTKDIKILSIRKKIKENEVGSVFNELIPLIEKYKLTPYDSPITIYHDTEYNEDGLIDMEVAVPIEDKDKSNEYIRTLKGGTFIYSTYKGSYETLSDVIRYIYTWKEDNNYKLNGSPYQKYIKGVGDTDNPDEYVTEIYLPVTL